MQVRQIDFLHEVGAKKNQEDYLWPLPGEASEANQIFIVCDGVGGSDNGEVASRVVAASVGRALTASPAEASLLLINDLLEGARRELVDYAMVRGLGRDMATTFTLLQLVNERAFIAWCGDSRIYHFRGNEILFRSDDHSLVHSLVRKGELTEDEAREHPQKNLLLKAIRADDARPEAEARWIRDIEEDDEFLLCTDGLLENVTDADLQRLLEQQSAGGRSLGEALRQACEDKTRDNYSMYLIRVSPASAPVETVTGKGTRQRIGWLILLLMILVGAAAFILKANYSSPVNEIKPLIPENTNRDTTPH